MTSPAPNGTAGPVQVAIKSRPPGISTQHFTYQVSNSLRWEGRVYKDVKLDPEGSRKHCCCFQEVSHMISVESRLGSVL